MTVARLLAGLAVLAVSVAATALLLPDPRSDVFFAGIVMFAVLFGLVGGVGVWTDRTPLVWLAALLMTGLSVLGMTSIGVFLLPAALLLIGAAAFSHRGGPRRGVRASILANPPSRQDIARRVVSGVVSVVLGGGLVYVGAFRQELFGSCARETLACAVETTNWGAVGLTLCGLAAVGGGGWMLWRQSYVARVLASEGNW